MKKNLIIFLTLLFLLLTACEESSFTIDYNSVEKAIIWTHQSKNQLTEDEVLKIIEEYNKSIWVCT